MIYVFDYATLKLIWWLFVGVLLIGFAILDGYDLGVGALLPFVGRTDAERRIVIRSVSATWEGNQVWFITAGGAIFAAWPLVYATAFSGFYVALILTLFALFFRPVGFEYRSKLADPRWRDAWDWALFVGGAVPALIFGVAFGNLLQGVPFHFDGDQRVFYTGSFWGLLNPFALLAGVVSLAMLTMHGAIFLQLRTEGALQDRARSAALLCGLVFLAAFALAGVWVASSLPAFRIASMPDANSAFMPLAKSVERTAGGWLGNYSRYPWTIAAPVLAFGATFVALYTFVALSVPNAFSGVPMDDSPAVPDGFIYFSFVTLTSTGYGDIVPIHPFARSLCNIEGIIGQLYPATLLARLVSLAIVRPRA